MRSGSRSLVIPWVAALGLAAALMPADHLGAQQEPVQVALTVVPTIAQIGDTITVQLTLTIAQGWHVYRTVGSAGQRKLALTLTVPAGVESVGTWMWPKGEDVFEGATVEIYQGTPVFTHRLRVTAALAAADTTTLGTTVRYQACNAQLCGPPTTLDVSTVLHVRSAPVTPAPRTGAAASFAPASDKQVRALVGRLVPAPLAAPHWLNAARGTTHAELTAPATLVEFTWPGCEDCAKGYPTLRALAQRYGAAGLRLVFMTYLFGSTPDLEVATVDQELAYDQHYWQVLQPLPFPIGVLAHPQTTEFPPLFDTYAVTGAPTYYLIDRHGIVRAAQRGHRADLAAWLTAEIEPLLGTGS